MTCDFKKTLANFLSQMVNTMHLVENREPTSKSVTISRNKEHYRTKKFTKSY